MDKKAHVAVETEKASQKFDNKTIESRELGAHHLTKANAIQAGRPVLARTTKALKSSK